MLLGIDRPDAAAGKVFNAADEEVLTVRQVVVNDLKDNTFFAVIELNHNGNAINIDARPSDAIALALRACGLAVTTGTPDRPVWPALAEMTSGQIVLVLDNLNTHTPAALYEAFPPAEAAALVLRADWQGGFVAYLNGGEVVRRSLGAPGSPLTFTNRSEWRPAGWAEDIVLTNFASQLRPGTNVLAVQLVGQWARFQFLLLSLLHSSSGCAMIHTKQNALIVRQPEWQRLASRMNLRNTTHISII